MRVNRSRYTKTIRIWLIIGLVLLIGQVVLGGITRLTGSGLSITRWDIFTGVIPPLNAQEWMDVFELYKKTPQFSKINSTFSLEDFKFIYFWEYFHRLWARLLGMIFLIPFLLFGVKRQLDYFIMIRLGIVVLLTILTAAAGWIMVQSGLVNTPWVNAYKLSIHFMLAIAVIAAMVKTIADVYGLGSRVLFKKIKPIPMILLWLTVVQLIFGSLMSGMRAGLYYRSWPDMNGEFLPKVLTIYDNWTWENMINYELNLFAPTLVQFAHRILSYILVVMTVMWFFKYKNSIPKKALNWLNYSVLLIVLQVILGVLTVLNAYGKIPLFFGASHQLIGLVYMISLLFMWYSLRNIRHKKSPNN